MKNFTSTKSFKAGLGVMMVLALVGTSLLQAQSLFTNTVQYSCWGNAVNWDPNGIPNAADATVTLGNFNVETTNSTENITAAGTFPYIFGALNGPASGAVPTIGASSATTRQLRAQVSSGSPTINVPQGSMYWYSVLYGNQGFTKTGVGNLVFRFNGFAQQFTGTVYIVQGSIDLNQDSNLGYISNSVVLYDQAALCAGKSGAPQTVWIAPERGIILNAPGGAGRIAWHGSGYTNVIQCVISESAANSGLETRRPVTQLSGTTGTVMLCNSNTYTGPTIVSEGVLVLSNQYAITPSTLRMNGGAVAFHTGIAANAFTVGGLEGTGNLALQNTAATAIALTAGGNNADSVYSGNLTGAGTLIKVGTGTLDIQGTGNNTAGLLTVSNGTVILGKTSSGSVHAINNGVAISGGTVRLSGSGSDQIADTKTVTINSGTFDLNGLTEIIGGLAGNGGTNSDSTLGTSATLLVKVASGSVTNASTITGGNLIFGGAGIQAFNGVDNRDAYVSGLTTTVTNGTLQVGTGGTLVAFGGATGIVATSPGTLALNGTGTFTNNLSGTGNLAVNSAGTVTYTGSATHTGNTLVNSGTLAVGTGATAIGGTVVSVASNATFNVAAGAGAFEIANGQTLNGYGTVTGNFSLAGSATLNPGAAATAGTLTVTGDLALSSGSQSFIYKMSTNSTAGGGTNALLVVSGNLNFGSATPVLTINGTPSAGTYTLATFGSFTGLATQLQVPTGGSLTYTPVINGNTLQLVVTGSAQNQVWRGDGTANVWDSNNLGNPVWFNTSSSTLNSFGTGDSVLFDDSSTNPVVTLTGTLQPSSLLVNSSSNLTFTGSGAIDGGIALLKTNSGSLTIQNDNTFTGPVNLNGGVISVATVAAAGTAQPLGKGSTLAFDGGTLQYTGTGGTLGQSATVGTGGATIDQSGSAALTVASAVTGNGSLSKTGTSQLVISGNNTGYTGVTYVQNGQLQLNNANALGNGASMVYATNGAGSVAVGGGVTGTIVKPLTLAGDGGGNGALQGFSAATFSGAVSLATNASIGGTASNTLSGIIDGAGMLTKVGTGTHVLTAANTYSGGTTISTGTLQLGKGGTTGWIGPVPVGWSAITNDGCLAISHSDNVSLTNSIAGAGWIHQIGSGLLTLGASNNFTGGNVFNYPTIGMAFTGAVGVDGPVLVTNSFAFGTVGAAATAKVQLAGNISIPAPIAVWSSALGTALIENVSGTNSIDQVYGLYGNNYWPITASGGLLSISTFSNVIYNSTYGRTLELQGAASGSLTNTIDPSFYWLLIQKDGTGTWSLEGSIDAPQGFIVNAGTLILNGGHNPLLRDQSVSTTVAGGTLLVNGSLAVGTTSGNVAVNGGSLGGIGNIWGKVTVGTGGALSPSAGTGTNTASLNINGDLFYGGKGLFKLNKSLIQSNDFVMVSGAFTNTAASTLAVTNLGPILVTNDTFVLFSQPMLQGTNVTIIGGAPAGKIITWTNNLAVDGSIRVLSIVDAVNTNTFTIGTSVSGGNLNLTWPPDRMGWKLWVQTNSLSAGLGTNWFLWPNSTTVTNVTIPINSADPSVFFRMTYP